MEIFAFFAGIGILIFFFYAFISIAAFGVTKSLSETYYKWKEIDSRLKWPFSIALGASALLLAMPMIHLGEDSIWQFTGFLAPFGLLMVAGAPDYNNNKLIDKIWHPVVAYICGIGAILWQIFIADRIDYLIGCLGIALILSLITKSLKRAHIFWIEMACFVSTFLCLIKIFFF